MVSIRQRIFVVCGANFFQRQRAIESIKKRIPQTLSSPLNTLTFYSNELTLKVLREALLTAGFTKTKIVLFKDFSYLDGSIRKFLSDNYKKVIPGAHLIFETDKNYYQLQKDKDFMADPFFTFLMRNAAAIRVSSFKKTVSLEDLRGSVRRNDLIASLYVAERLFESQIKERALGPQIIGMLVSTASCLKGSSRREKYYIYLWEADRAIKERGINPRLVIETLLVKLCQLN